MQVGAVEDQFCLIAPDLPTRSLSFIVLLEMASLRLCEMFRESKCARAKKGKRVCLAFVNDTLAFIRPANCGEASHCIHRDSTPYPSQPLRDSLCLCATRLITQRSGGIAGPIRRRSCSRHAVGTSPGHRSIRS